MCAEDTRRNVAERCRANYSIRQKPEYPDGFGGVEWRVLGCPGTRQGHPANNPPPLSTLLDVYMFTYYLQFGFDTDTLQHTQI